MKTISNILIIFVIIAQFEVFPQENINSELTLERIYANHEFKQPKLAKSQWFDSGDSYTILEKLPNGAQNIVKYETATGKKNTLINSEDLIPANSDRPISIYNYEFSSDLKLVLIFTNTKKVWRTNTRGDYWIFNRETKLLKKLGGSEAKSSTLMFATLSPNNECIAYVRENNLFVESIYEDKITQLTHDGSNTIINGTFDWVYEEELKVKNGFRWSPDGKRISYWQLDANGIGVFNMINNTDSIYSKIIPVQYPKVGTKNSACKVGVVDLEIKETTWIKIPGDPRNNYIARMEWAESSDELIIQQLNRLQNENRVYIATASNGNVNNIFTNQNSKKIFFTFSLKF